MPLPHSTGIVPGALISCSSLPLALYMGRSEARGGGAAAAAKAAGQTLSACEGRTRRCFKEICYRHGAEGPVAVPRPRRAKEMQGWQYFKGQLFLKFFGEGGLSMNPRGSTVAFLASERKKTFIRQLSRRL